MSMTPEELAALTASITESLMPKMAEIANAASTAQVKRLEKQLADAKPVAPPPAPETPKVDPAVSEKIKATPELAALESRYQEMEKRWQDAENARKTAEDQRRNDATFNALRGSLTGVRDGMQDVAAKVLFHVEKRVTFDENGEPLFRVTRTNALGSPEAVDMPLSDGVGFWLKSKEAAPFLPAPGQNTGSGVGGRAPVSIPTSRNAAGIPVYDAPASNDQERIARAANLEAALKKQGIE